MLYLTVCLIVLAVYCIALTVVVRREIKDIRHRLNTHSSSLDYCIPRCRKNYNEIQELKTRIEKADEFLSDLWDRIDATVDKMLDIRVENILKERDALETKYSELLQKHNDLAAAYDEYKMKHPDYITVTAIPVAKPDDRVTTCELKIEDDDFVDISDGKDEEA